MADTEDSKFSAGNSMSVRVRPPAPERAAEPNFLEQSGGR